jgi:acyl-CoA thioester hydrolase
MRVHIDLPEYWLFRTHLTVRVGDINYGGHLGNDRVLAFAHEARVRWLAELGLSEKDVGGVGLIMADAVLTYHREAFMGDELQIALGAADVRRSSFDLIFWFSRLDDGEEIARVKTGMVCFDYDARKAARLPADFARCLAQEG